MSLGAILGQTPTKQPVDAQDVTYSGTATGSNVKEALDGLSGVDSELQAAVQALTTTVSGKAQVVTGSYVGIGAQGVNNPTIISFTSIPKVLVVVGTSGYYEFLCCRIPPEGETITCMTDGNTGVYLKTSGNSVSFYSTTSARIQLNQSGIQYYYAGIL